MSPAGDGLHVHGKSKPEKVYLNQSTDQPRKVIFWVVLLPDDRILLGRQSYFFGRFLLRH